MIIYDVLLGLILLSSHFLAVFAAYNITTTAAAAAVSPRIVGGTVADQERFPYYVHLQIIRSGSSSRCGATLIAADFALTAAHCVQSSVGSASKQINAYVKAFESSSSEYPREVATAWIHPGYDATRMQYDVALLKLNMPVPSEAVRPVRLNDDDDLPPNGLEVSVMGLGLVSETGQASSRLREVDVNVVSWEDCNDRNSYFNFIDDDLMICAGVNGGGKDSCQGDSGGPLVIKNADGNNNDVQVGIASFGTGCARPNKPGGYARVSASLNWIQQVVCRESSDTTGQLCSTPEPTRVPTRPPTPFPTPLPTPEPTRPPTLSPTDQPTPVPTEQPTPWPTYPPTTLPPTSFPTEQPILWRPIQARPSGIPYQEYLQGGLPSPTTFAPSGNWFMTAIEKNSSGGSTFSLFAFYCCLPILIMAFL